MTEQGSLREQIAAAIRALRFESDEWKQLLRALRAQKSTRDELLDLGAAACLSPNELSEVANYIAAVPGLKKLAARARSLTGEYQKLVANIDDLQAKLGKASDNDQREGLAVQVEAAESARRKLEGPWLEATQAENRLVALQTEGVLD